MVNCLLCNRSLTKKLTISEIVFPGPIREQVVCKVCFQKFDRYSSKDVCRGCGRENKGELCADCQRWQQQYGWYLSHRPLFHYNQAMKEFMQQYKFQGQYHLRAVFQQSLQTVINQMDYDLLIPIPVTNHTMRTRGFNQVTGLLENIRYTELIKHREKQKVAQSKKDRQSRLKAKQPFFLNKRISLQGQRIVLVDDIYTTGRTLYHAAELCYQNGCKRVQSLSLAR
ncbi:ComF family protein [Limosilactobacillus portuensis]|uniref:ComF family protein n=1 Tax=Limosilactobacillus portuensis TaxID=2742601 RepID=UPI003D72B242